MRSLQIFGLIVLLLYPCIDSLAEIHVVNSKNSFIAAHSAAAAGDTILWEQGLYYNIDLNISKSHLVIMAEIPGKTVFTGASKAYFSGSYITFSGFQYFGGNIGTDNVLESTGSYNHFTQLNIQNYFCYKYVVINEQCEYNTLSYCNLENRTYIGNKNILSILVSANKPGYHTIRYCSFKNFEGTGGDMGVEPIRIGLSTMGEFISRSVVEYCYFTQCSGDGEIISNKSRQNVYRYNTFENNPLGQLVLRHGDEGVVYGNFFLNGMGGVRIKEGQGHVVYNNYFSGLASKAIDLQNYDVDPLDNITIAYNTFMDCAELDLGGPGNFPPAHVTFANNIFAYPEGNLFSDATGTEEWIGNISYGSLGITRPEGMRDADPGLELNSEGYYGLSLESTAIDSAQSGYPALPDYPGMEIDNEVAYDLMKQARPADILMKDIGCSEYPQELIIKPHVIEGNTGPSYLHEENFVILDITRQGEGTVLLDPPSGVYDSGTVVTLNALPLNYSFFKEWGGDLTGTGNPDTLIMNSDKQVTAYFDTPTLHKVTVFTSGSGHSEVDPPGWNYPDSTLITITAIPDSGYVFSQWTGQLSGTENPIDVLITDYIVAFANFVSSTVSINEIADPGLSFGQYAVNLFPNPADNAIAASFSVNKLCHIEWSIFDMNGARLRTVDAGLFEPGKHLIEADISDIPAGIYAIRMKIIDQASDNENVTFDEISGKFLKQ